MLMPNGWRKKNVAPKADQLRLYSRIVKGLETQPAFLLVFAVCCLFAISGLTGSVYGTVQGQITAQILGFLSLLVSLAATVLVVRTLIGQQKTIQPDLEISQ